MRNLRFRDLAAMAYPATMSQFSRDPRGARDFSSPQIRIRGAGDFRHYTSQRLRLPNERPPLGPIVRRLFGVLIALALVGGIGVGVYFGVTELLEDDDTTPDAAAQAVEQSQAAPADQASAQPAAAQEQAAAQESQAAASESSEQSSAEADPESGDNGAASQPEPQQEAEPEAQQAAQPASEPPSAPMAISTLEPTVSEQPVTPAQIGGAEVVVDRVTAEPIPSGIPRSLADGADYDSTSPTTAFTTRWPVGTTLRLTRLPGATLLTDEQQQQVIGVETLVVVRATESSNTDLQLSPAAFDQIAFFGVERIIAVRVEVTAPPPQ